MIEITPSLKNEFSYEKLKKIRFVKFKSIYNSEKSLFFILAKNLKFDVLKISINTKDPKQTSTLFLIHNLEVIRATTKCRI